MKIKIFLTIISFSSMVFAVDQNEISKNVNTVEPGATYKGDYDTSKFRVGISKSNYQSARANRSLASLSSVRESLKSSTTMLCNIVKQSSTLDLKSSSAYVVSALKEAGAIPTYDKDYSLISSHFLWELYLGYRNFVDLSRSLSREGSLTKDMLPQGAIVNVEKGCNENGATAVFCDGRFYTTRFVNDNKLFRRINDPSDNTCKLGNGLRVIVEAERLKNG